MSKDKNNDGSKKCFALDCLLLLIKWSLCRKCMQTTHKSRKVTQEPVVNAWFQLMELFCHHEKRISHSWSLRTWLSSCFRQSHVSHLWKQSTEWRLNFLHQVLYFTHKEIKVKAGDASHIVILPAQNLCSLLATAYLMNCHLRTHYWLVILLVWTRLLSSAPGLVVPMFRCRQMGTAKHLLRGRWEVEPISIYKGKVRVRFTVDTKAGNLSASQTCAQNIPTFKNWFYLCKNWFWVSL